MRRALLFVSLAVLSSACLESAPRTRPTSPGTTPTDIGGAIRSLVAEGAPRWRVLAEAPEARQEVAATLHKGRVYVAGGLTANGATDRVDVYDVEKNTWSPGPKLPKPLHHAMAATYKGQVLVIGGFDASNVPSNRVYRLFGGSWQGYGRLNRGRAAGAAVVTGSGSENERLFVVGGQSSGELAAVTEEFDRRFTRWIDRAPIPTPRHHVAAATNNRFIFVTGGRRPTPSGGADSNVAAFDRYAVDEDRWEQLPNVPTPRSGHGAGLVNGKVVVTGGEDPTAHGTPSIATTEEYDIARNIWGRTLPPMFRPRHGVGVVTIGDDIYVFLGGSRAALAPTADSDVLITP